jgi:hypothetical protein
MVSEPAPDEHAAAANTGARNKAETIADRMADMRTLLVDPALSAATHQATFPEVAARYPYVRAPEVLSFLARYPPFATLDHGASKTIDPKFE